MVVFQTTKLRRGVQMFRPTRSNVRSSGRCGAMPPRSQALSLCRNRAAAPTTVGQIGARLGERADAVIVGHRRTAEGAQLRKHEPHPVAPLPARPQLTQRRIEDRLLRAHEAIEIARVGHLSHPPSSAVLSAIMGSLHPQSRSRPIVRTSAYQPDIPPPDKAAISRQLVAYELSVWNL